ncbi:hypothetical protein KO481_05295 [Nocardia sp. NEAU-G5]|uniref:Uncharacterized protein n=1 Tax=Nocardia albiluteola TaxID=2842303 RepID=A0ABS6ASR6_9NOCA|nr:hypothetical protein [Nocardia albiluteola]MBU3060938.1 hypothetical protein [Nocardia albiluteola]
MQACDAQDKMVCMADPLRLRVGGYYDSGIQRWPGAELILTIEGCLLLVDQISPTAEQIAEFETAQAQFAWLDGRHNGILLYRFGEASWTGLPFNPHEDTPPGMSAGLPRVESRQHLAVSVGLADVDRAPVVAVRTIRWPERFVSAISATVLRLTQQDFDHASRIDEANYLHLFVGNERLAQRAGMRCTSTN